ncbi:MAG TPA: hypothetical protein VFW09_12955 [Solirubrobacteraceae bacterium]|nr:hypothetical protein [Solirubrobacteraceae bacterium]
MRWDAGRRLLTALELVLLASGVVVGQAGAATVAPASAARYVFSIPTVSGSLRARGDRHLTLKLVVNRNYLTRFTERPLRRAFRVANVDFARRFKCYFGKSGPNAVLTYTPRGSRNPASIVLTVGQPRWNAKRATWTFPATRIRKQPDNLPGTTVQNKPPLITNPRSFTRATLLIDDTTPAKSLELSGQGIADSVGGFLQQLFTTAIPWIPGQQFHLVLGVHFQFPVDRSGTVDELPVLVGNSDGFAPASGWRVQPNSFACQMAARIVAWQSIEMPSLVGARYTFDLAVYGVSQEAQLPIYSSTLQYPIPPGGAPASPGCSSPG